MAGGRQWLSVGSSARNIDHSTCTWHLHVAWTAHKQGGLFQREITPRRKTQKNIVENSLYLGNPQTSQPSIFLLQNSRATQIQKEESTARQEYWKE